MLTFDPDTFGKLNAETYDAGLAGQTESDPSAAVERLAELARGGPVLELAIGTGRIALPLAARGLAVSGIEGSPEMVAHLREKPSGADIPVVIGDMADVAIEGQYALVALVFNTLFNLTSQEAQVRCFAGAARRLTADGVFVIEAFVPEIARYADRQRVRTLHVGFEGAVIEASTYDPLTQRIDYQRLRIGNRGVRATPLALRVAWPAELDLMAQLAGLRLRDRWADWNGAPFTADSQSHISVYARA